jgi:hypothetical protein
MARAVVRLENAETTKQLRSMCAIPWLRTAAPAWGTPGAGTEQFVLAASREVNRVGLKDALWRFA